ncbi:MAG: zinc-binding dehydrogenase, partial [Candidatus Firestonebacteria bacterium]
RVGVAPNAGCGLCQACINGMSNYCPEYTAFGIDMDGGHTEYVRVPSKFVRQGNVNILPEGISDLEGSVLEPFSCVVNGVRKSQIVLGDTVVIFGAGPIGMMHLMLVKILGAAKIIMVDINPERLEKALKSGAGYVINSSKEDVKKNIMSLSSGRGADVIITACPVREVQEMATDVLAPFGRLSFFGGLPAGSSKIQFDSNAVHYKNLIVTGTTGGSIDDYRRGMELAVNGKVDLASIVSDSFPLNELEAAYAKAQNAPAGKVVLINS